MGLEFLAAFSLNKNSWLLTEDEQHWTFLPTKQEDRVAHFGGVYAIQQARSCTPEGVLHAFTQLAYLRKQRGEQIVQPLPIIHCKTVETIEAETGKMINENVLNSCKRS